MRVTEADEGTETAVSGNQTNGETEEKDEGG